MLSDKPGEILKARWFTPLGGRREDGSDTAVVGSLRCGPLRFGEVVRRYTENEPVIGELAGGIKGEIVLAEMDAIGLGGDCDIGPIIDDDGCAAGLGGEPVREFNELPGALESFVVWDRFLAVLDAVGSGLDGCSGDIEPVVVCAEVLRDDHAEPPLLCGVVQGGELCDEQAFGFVSVVAELLECGGGLRVIELGVFFE